jgi:hypothetical protein
MSNNENDSGGLLRSSLAFAPLGVGGAVTARNVIRDNPFENTGKSPIVSSVENFTPSGNVPRIPNSNEIHQFMTRGSVGRPVHGDVARQAWQWAMQGTDPTTRENLLHYTKGIDTMSRAEAIKAIGMTVESNRSGAMASIWGRFRKNVSALEEHRNLYGTVGQFVPVETGKVTQPFMGGIPTGLGKRFGSAAKAFGGSQPLISAVTRPELAEQGFAVFHSTLRTKLGDLAISVPNIQSGLMFEGSTLQTKRIAPDVVLATEGGLERMSRSEYFLREIEESIAPDIGTRIKTERQLKQAVKQLRAEVFGELESVPAVSPGLRTAAQAQYESIRGQAVDIRVPTKARKIFPGSPDYVSVNRVPTDIELSQILQSRAGQQMGLRGGVGPKAMSTGRLSTVPWEEYDITGGPVEYGRRPEQPFRHFQLTEQATEYMRSHSRIGKYRAYEVGAQSLSAKNAMGPSLKMAYVNPELHAEMMEGLAIGNGEAALRSSIAGRLEFESLESIRLANVREDLVGGDFRGLLPGEIIGTTDRGAPFRFAEGMDIKGIEQFESVSQGQFARVAYTQRHGFEHGDKLFGGAKAVTHIRSGSEFRAALKQIGAGTDTDMIVSMDELKKNKALHRRQMLTSLTEIAAGNKDLNSQKRAINLLKQRDVMRLSAGLVKSATRAGVYSHERFVENLMRFASRNLDLTSGQFGEVFGAVPHVLGEEQASSLLARVMKPMGFTAPEWGEVRKAMFSGIAGGVGSLSYGGPAIDVG